MNAEQFDRIRQSDGFIAALDQSGGSSPKALGLYGIPEGSWSSEDEMFDLVHQMRVRIMTSAAFGGDRVMGAILFEQTMDRQVEGRDTGDYLWDVKGVVPFLKVDKGLAEEDRGVQVMKPIAGLDQLLERAVAKGMFGTKMRSVVKHADSRGVAEVLDQQFEIGRHIVGTGLVPILEPEIDINSPSKAEAEELLLAGIMERLGALGPDEKLMFKVTLPEVDGYYTPVLEHPNTVAVVALSGGYSRVDANERLSRNPGVVASFSRALTEGLRVDQSDEEFDAALDEAIASIHAASVA